MDRGGGVERAVGNGRLGKLQTGFPLDKPPKFLFPLEKGDGSGPEVNRALPLAAGLELFGEETGCRVANGLLNRVNDKKPISPTSDAPTALHFNHFRDTNKQIQYPYSVE